MYISLLFLTSLSETETSRFEVNGHDSFPISLVSSIPVENNPDTLVFTLIFTQFKVFGCMPLFSNVSPYLLTTIVIHMLSSFVVLVDMYWSKVSMSDR